MILVDTNVLLRHILEDHPDQSPRATAFWRSVEAGEYNARISDMALFETVFTLQRNQRVPRSAIRLRLMQILDMPGVSVSSPEVWEDAFELYERGRLSLAGSYHAALAGHLGISEIASFDRDFDRVPDLTRVEP